MTSLVLRTIDLSSKLIATARAAVVNVTATQTAGPGFVAAFADGPPRDPSARGPKDAF